MGDLELRRAYGEGDLAALPVFAGGFINFGYWAGIPLDGELTVEQRVASQRALYDLVVDALGVGPGDRVLEVGAGSERQTARKAGEALVPAVIGGEQHVALGMTMVIYRFGEGSAEDRVVHPVGAVEPVRRNPVEPLEKSLRLAYSSLPRLRTEIGDPVVIIANAQGRRLDRTLPKKPLIMFGHQGAQIVGRGGQCGRGEGEG